jgi:hypothetical protein
MSLTEIERTSDLSDNHPYVLCVQMIMMRYILIFRYFIAIFFAIRVLWVSTAHHHHHHHRRRRRLIISHDGHVGHCSMIKRSNISDEQVSPTLPSIRRRRRRKQKQDQTILCSYVRRARLFERCWCWSIVSHVIAASTATSVGIHREKRAKRNKKSKHNT